MDACPVQNHTSARDDEGEVSTDFREEALRISTVVIRSVVWYLPERRESFEGVLAQNIDGERVERANSRALRSVPPVAPKMATVFCGEDIPM